MKNIFASLSLLLSFSAFSQSTVLTDPWLLRELGIKALSEDLSAKVAYAVLNDKQVEDLHELAHKRGRCGGYELISNKATLNLDKASDIFSRIKRFQRRDLMLQNAITLQGQERETISERNEIHEAIKLVNKDQIKSFVAWFSSFPTRYNRSSSANIPMQALVKKIQDEILIGQPTWKVDMIAHESTAQKSVRVTIPGRSHPEEIVVLGGHADSINQWSGNAPGADDNASGSANVFESLRILSNINFNPERSVHFFFYAGEESGLLGSAEIAESYKSEGKKVIAVMQLDMTSFPGSGPFKFSNMTDFTHPQLRQLLEDLNRLYVGGEVIHSACGYGCSDHASWYRNGYAAVIPFESHMDDYNPNIHTDRDVIFGQTNFEHSAMFNKLALSFVIEIAQSNWHAL